MKEKDINSLDHTAWNCKYHMVFAPKYRRKEVYGKIRKDMGEILRKLCNQKGVEIIEAEACIDHIYAGKHFTAHEYSTVHGISQS